MNRDTTVGIVGSAILVAAMVAVFAYERANAAATPEVTPAMTHIMTKSLTGSVGVGASDSKMDNITAAGPVTITFNLKWTAQAMGSKDTLKLTITPPKGNVSAPAPVSSDTGDLSVQVKVPAGTVLRGNWGVSVEFTKATPGTLPGGVMNPNATTDSTVAYTVSVSA